MAAAVTLQASRAALPPGPTGMPLAIALLLLTGLLCCSLIDHTLADAANGTSAPWNGTSAPTLPKWNGTRDGTRTDIKTKNKSEVCGGGIVAAVRPLRQRRCQHVGDVAAVVAAMLPRCR